ncbi:glycosyltransferase family 2 protein [Sphingomonas qilianensis]|uniref:Glycosyltransferase family 2 protein n=1 Tax=Sphingomonas qilianensis TaxID=1736690 RepID=A0ABU9XU54_9SPHN
MRTSTAIELDKTLPARAPARGPAPDSIELSIVMPCLNEAETLAVCIRKAQQYLEVSGVRGEVIIADNGSTDGSRQIANAMGARIVAVEARGYGAALIGGIAAARGTYVIIGDADDSYDFRALQPFVDALRAGGELVMGDRFLGGIASGAMPSLHRYIGNPVLSFLGRVLFDNKISDFHCGLRGFRRDAILALGLRSTGMEFASEMVVKAVMHRLDVCEVATTLSPDGRSRAPHLRTWRDGWRHLRFLLTYAPRFLFVYPGLACAAFGVAGIATLAPGSVTLGHIELSATTMLFAAMLLLLGSQLISFGVIARLYGVASNLWPSSRRVEWFRARFSVERGALAGGVLTLAGISGATLLIGGWATTGFGPMDGIALMRLAIPAMVATLLGLQTVFTSFLIGLVDTRIT